MYGILPYESTAGDDVQADGARFPLLQVGDFGYLHR